MLSNDPVLPALPDEDRERHEIRLAYEAMAGAEGPFFVTWRSHGTAGILVTFDDHLRCPASGPRRQAHDATLKAWAERLERAGFTSVSTTTCGAVGIAPPEFEAVSVTVRREDGFDSDRIVTFAGYAGACRYRLLSLPSVAFYEARSHSGRAVHVPRSVTREADVVHAITDHYGFPAPRHIVFERPDPM
jgi:hypothetical protein